MVDQPSFNPAPTTPSQTPVPSDTVLRQTQHMAMPQVAPVSFPQVSYEAEDYTPPAPQLNTYQPPTSQVTTPPATPPVNITSPVATPPPPQPAPSQTATPVPEKAPTPTTPVPVTQAPAATPPRRSEPNQYFPEFQKPILEEVVLEWESPSRPFKKRSRQYYSTGIIIVLLLSMILFFAQQLLPIAVVVAVAFLAYVLSVVPPGMIKHTITTYGLRLEDHLYYWDELGRFWFSEKYGKQILHVEVARFPWRLTMLLGDRTEQEITDILSEVLIKQRPKLSAYEKASEWLQAKIPLDSD